LHIYPPLPVPLVCHALLDAGVGGLKSLEIVVRTHDRVDTFIANGAAMKTSEKPRQKTIENALEMLRLRGIVSENEDVFQIVGAHRTLVDYYANSLAHFNFQ
jgi:hypothetical protein